MSSRARRTALLVAWPVAVATVVATAAPAGATTTSMSGLSAGLTSAAYSEQTSSADRLSTFRVDLLWLDGRWLVTADAFDLTTGNSLTYVTRHADAGMVDPGAVHVSDNGASLTLDAVPATMTVDSSDQTHTVGATTLSGTFKIAGGDQGGNGSETYTPPATGCGSADHYTDRVRIADATVTAFGATHTARGSKQGGPSMSYWVLNGTANC
jgi:hypothetical protein